FSSRRRHTRFSRDWSSDVCSSDLEEGFDIQWPIIRGFYVGPKVSDADYQWWVDAFDKTQADASFAAIRDKQGLFPFNKSGAELDKYVKARVADYTKLANEFGLIRQ